MPEPLDDWINRAVDLVAHYADCTRPRALTAVAIVFEAIDDAIDAADTDEDWPQPTDLHILAAGIRAHVHHGGEQ